MEKVSIRNIDRGIISAALFFCCLLPTVIQGEKGLRVVPVKTIELTKHARIALIIGNSAYATMPLKNPGNDARDLAATLKQVGFKVTLKIDASQREMRRAIKIFGKQLDSSGVGLFFYSGHGMQVKGVNYLIPIGAGIESEDDVQDYAVDANSVLRKMETAANALNIIILDACRNNPFMRSFRSSHSGLAQMDAPRGSLIVFATAPGREASDGTGRNSPFTKNLLHYMKVPGLELSQLMKRVRAGVQRDTDNKQTPWDTSSLTVDFYFPEKNASGIYPVEPLPSDDINPEEEMWQMVKKTSRIEDVEMYLRTYPEGRFKSAAALKLSQLKRIKKSSKTHSMSGKTSSRTPGRLNIITEPKDAKIFIVNKKVPFVQGMKLAAGRYHMSISAGGYSQNDIWVEMRGHEEKRSLNIKMKPIAIDSQNLKIDNSVGMDFVFIPPGTFMMGSPWDEPARREGEVQHLVTISKGFYMQATEVTQEQWQTIMGNNPSTFKDCVGADCPAKQVSWYDAQKFIKNLNKIEGTEKYRLPTEAEWEYACRAGSHTAFSFGNFLTTNQANYNGEKPMQGSSKGEDRHRSVPVASFAPNAWGLYDMHGNIYEWCLDWYGSNPAAGAEPIIDPLGPSTGSDRVYRGGSWESAAALCRSAFRFGYTSGYRNVSLGFRIVKER